MLNIRFRSFEETAMGLDSINHIVVLALENRSFDHMLGFLYDQDNNQPRRGQQFDGLTGNETNPDADGKLVTITKITNQTPNAYWYPLCNPGEGFENTNQQLFDTDPTSAVPVPPDANNQGFIRNFTTALADANAGKPYTDPPWPGAQDSSVMAAFTPEALPVMSGLARGFAVCDRWFASVPTQTIPNRSFLLAGTSQGHLNNHGKNAYSCPSIFGALTHRQVSWKAYGDKILPYVMTDFPDTRSAPSSCSGKFPDFQAEAAAGQLPGFCFLEPDFGNMGNSQHPADNVAAGEQFIHDVYRACRDGKDWNSTLLLITYDEHGGNYDHVAPPTDATPPGDGAKPDFGFDFARFGVRVPALLISPLIEAGTIYRAPAGGPPLDHTSLLATARKRWGFDPLTNRDRAAPDFASALTLDVPRGDDPLDGVVPPAVTPATDNAGNAVPAATAPNQLQLGYAERAANLSSAKVAAVQVPAHLHTSEDYDNFINDRLTEWNSAKPL
jgi:phospholipase C